MRLIRYFYGLLLAVAYYVCCTQWLSYVIFFYAEHSTFRYGRAYFEECVHLDGLTAYVDNWLTAMLARPAIGVAVIALLCASVYYLTEAIIRGLTRRPDVAALSVGASIATFIASATRTQGSPTAAWLVPLCLLGVWLVIVIVNRFLHRGPVKPIRFLRGLEGWIWLVAALIWSGAGYYRTLGSIDLSERAMLLSEKALREGNYDEVMERTGRYLGAGHSNRLMSLFRNYVLAQRGELADGLLDYPMPFGLGGLAFPWNTNSLGCEYGALPYEATGHINEALHWENEALVVWGATARHLVSLARYNIVMDRPDAARRYIRLLARMPFHAEEARRLEREVDDPAAVELRYSLRDYSPEPAEWSNVTNIVHDLEYVCAADSTNTVAQQYLLCGLLLGNNVSRFAELLPVYGPAGPLPRLYEEALLLNELRDGVTRDFDPRVSNDTRSRFRRFVKLSETGNEMALRSEFQNSYWYYVTYVSPHGRKAR